MKGLLTAVFGILCLALFSCQKEVDDIFNTGNNNGQSSDGLLTKLSAKSGSDSTVISFTYDASKRLSAFYTDIVSGGTTVSVSERAERNSQGIIQRVFYKSPTYQQLGLDSVFSVIKYVGGKYTSEVTDFDIGGIIFSDSVALFYDGAGKVVKEESYFIMLGAAELTGKTEYTYSGNNVATIKTYSWDGSDFLLEETLTYDQYDDKVNPMYFGIDAFVFGSPLFFSANNPLKSSQFDGTTTVDFTSTYNYNSLNKPVSATSVAQPGGDVQTGTYYYK